MPQETTEVVTHLWDEPHPYYAAEGNYFANECHTNFASWAEFKEDGIFDADRDMNLVYRWDWCKPDPDDYDEDEEVPEGDTLKVYVMGQRKAKCHSQSVTVTEADEPEVRAWLIECAKTITSMWAPLSTVASGAQQKLERVARLAVETDPPECPAFYDDQKAFDRGYAMAMLDVRGWIKRTEE